MSLAARVILAAIEGKALSSDEEKFFRGRDFAGFTLFSRNIPEPWTSLDQLCEQLKSLRSERSILAIDQEGGRVRRIKSNFPDPGPALEIAAGRIDEGALAEIEKGSYMVNQELANLGINTNFAPVCDILTQPTNLAIGDRVFGTSVAQATPRIQAYLRGVLATTVLPCLKHFPGQGDAKADTHLAACELPLSDEQLRQRELQTFLPFLHQVPMVMLSHCIYPAWDDRPASLSSAIATRLLQQELGYRGLVLSDDMVMHAIPQDVQTWQQSLVASIAAGVDLLLVCRDLERIRFAVEALELEARKSSSFSRRLVDAATKVDRFCHRYLN